MFYGPILISLLFLGGPICAGGGYLRGGRYHGFLRYDIIREVILLFWQILLLNRRCKNLRLGVSLENFNHNRSRSGQKKLSLRYFSHCMPYF